MVQIPLGSSEVHFVGQSAKPGCSPCGQGISACSRNSPRSVAYRSLLFGPCPLLIVEESSAEPDRAVCARRSWQLRLGVLLCVSALLESSRQLEREPLLPCLTILWLRGDVYSLPMPVWTVTPARQLCLLEASPWKS